MLKDDTICAISTAAGKGGIAVLRISGKCAAEFARKCCPSLPNTLESHRIYLATFVDCRNNEPVDEVLVSFFQKGKSFTGEETVEISCHGGEIVSSLVLEILLASGLRLANPGEFTLRAYLNRRIDLTQAEGILGLIESQSKTSAKVAFRQLKGELSRRVSSIEDDVTWVLAQLEANIDFAAEGLELASPRDLQQRLQLAHEKVLSLLKTYEAGRVLSNGFLVTLVGSPNVGKSSLLNFLLEDDKAIVSEHPGTTRDFVEGIKIFKGVSFHFIDTAGLRSSDDPVERIGIERTLNKIKEADVVLWIRDVSEAIENSESEFKPEHLDFVIWNKADLLAWPERKALLENEFLVSAKTGFGIERLMSALLSKANDRIGEATDIWIQARHFHLLTKVEASLSRALRQVEADPSPEFVAFEMQDSLLSIFEVLGKRFDDQVMDRVFKEFCLGK